MQLYVFYSPIEPDWIVRACVDGKYIPLVTTDPSLLSHFYDIATVLSAQKNIPIDVLAFSRPELLRRIEPTDSELRNLN